MKCGIYIRSARALQTNRRVGMQLAECRAKASELGFDPGDAVLYDEGQRGGDTWWVGGGPGGTGTRVELGKLADAVKAGEIDTIIVQSRDRISDVDAIWTAFENLAEDHGVRLVALMDEERASAVPPAHEARPEPAADKAAGPETAPLPRREPRREPRSETKRRQRFDQKIEPSSPMPEDEKGFLSRLRMLIYGPPPPPPYRRAPLPTGADSMRPCAIYARSARSREAAVTIPAQIAQCTTAATRLGFTEDEIAIYDEGVIGGDTWWAGAGHKGSRNALGALVEAIQAGHIRTLIVATAPVISHMEPILSAFRAEVVKPRGVELVLCDMRPDLVEPTATELEPVEIEPSAPVRSKRQQRMRGASFTAAGLVIILVLGVAARGIAREGRAQYQALLAVQKKEMQRRAILGQALHPNGATRDSALAQYLILADRFGGDYDAAIAQARKDAQAAPTKPGPLVCLALLHDAKGEADEAEKLLKSAVGLDVTNPEPLIILAELRGHRGDNAGAEGYLQAAVRADPKDPRAYSSLADAYTRKGDLAKAARILEEGVARDTNDPLLRNGYALALLRKGDRAGAEEQLRILQTRNAASGVAKLLEAEIELSGNKRAEAVAALQQAVQINSELGQAYRMLGALHAADKKYAEAAAAYQNAIAVGSYDPTTFNELAYIMASAHAEPGLAAKLAQLAVAMEPTNPHLQDTLAWALYAKGDYKRALRVTTALMKTPNPSPTYRFHYGMSLLRNGDQRGYDEIRAATEAEPKAEWLEQARRALKGKLD